MGCACSRRTSGTYEYEDAVHVTLPALNKGTVEFLCVGEAYGPYFRRIVYGGSGISGYGGGE